MKSFTRKGSRLTISATADIPVMFRPSGSCAFMTQEAINQLGRLTPGTISHQTIYVDENLDAMTMENRTRVPRWGIHRFHKARRPDHSPFIDTGRSVPKVDQLTVELVMKPSGPCLIRVYAGPYSPPLPWQVSASEAPGGRRRCIEFWRQNSYVLKPSLVIGGLHTRAPQWWLTA